MTNFYSASA